MNPRSTVRLLIVLAFTLLSACSGIPETGATPAIPTVADPNSPPAATALQATAPAATATAAAPTLPPAATAAQASTAAIDCTPPAPPSPAMTEGPFYKSGSPERTSLLEPGMEGTPIILRGAVLTTDCQPVAGAWLDFWQTDAAGQYDNAGYRLRGHQLTDENGRYELETVLPGEYPGRTMHIHVKVQPPNGDVLTTQLFFPGAAGNQTDRIFAEELLVELTETADGLRGDFNFVVEP